MEHALQDATAVPVSFEAAVAEARGLLDRLTFLVDVIEAGGPIPASAGAPRSVQDARCCCRSASRTHSGTLAG